jgi:ABC-type multidrug transport system permease subunit
VTTPPPAGPLPLPLPAPPAGPADRLRWALADGWTVTLRHLSHWASQPGPVVINLAFPLMVALMFGYLFGGAMDAPSGDYFEFLMPGMFGMAMAFGIEATMLAVVTDATRGITDRFRSLPMAGSAVVLGRSLADMLSSVAGLALLAGCGLLVGWRWHDGPAAALAAAGLLLWLRFALLWVGIFLGLVSKGPESVAFVQILVWPLGFLSNAFVAPDTMPGWLGAVAEWNPLSATIAAGRELFGNPAWRGGGSWAAEHAVELAVAWPLVIVAVFLPLSVRRYRRLDR